MESARSHMAAKRLSDALPDLQREAGALKLPFGSIHSHSVTRAHRDGPARELNGGQLRRKNTEASRAGRLYQRTRHCTAGARHDWADRRAQTCSPGDGTAATRRCSICRRDRFLLILNDSGANFIAALRRPRLERAIGVIYVRDRAAEPLF